jgi:hypothetical protein
LDPFSDFFMKLVDELEISLVIQCVLYKKDEW